MKKVAASLIIAMGSGALCAQPIVDIGLFPSTLPNTLEVRLRPTGDFGDVVASLTFTIRWATTSSATLGTRVNTCPSGIPLTATTQVTNPLVNGIPTGFNYRTYNAFGTSLLTDEGCPLPGGVETVVMRVPVVNNEGIDQFQLINDVYTDPNGAFHISLVGENIVDCTGIIYSNMSPGPGNGVLQGWRFLDEDGDCAFGPGDFGIPYRVMQLLPGPIDVITGTSGFYTVLTTAEEYTLDQSLEPGVHPACPPTELLPVTIEDGVFGSLHIANTADDIVDVEVMAITDRPRAGFSYPVHLHVRNNGFSTSGPVSLSFTFDSQFNLVSSSPPPDLIIGNTLQWDLDPLQPFQGAGVELHILVPPEPALLGTTVDHLASVSTSPDADLTNNATSMPEIVVGSFDPNDKAAFTSSGSSPDQFFIDLDEWITYRIRFQNTGNYPAWMVVVTDTLDEGLDMSSFVQGPASHAFDVRFLPGRVVEWTFEGINLPDSTSDEPGSHGLLSYRIRPVQPLLPGTVIPNTANIYFDYNPPVITEPSLLTAEFSTGLHQLAGDALRVFPNPVSSLLQMSLPPGVASLRVRAGDGRLVMVRANKGDLSAVDVQHLPSGAYAVEAVTNEGTVHRARFIKQ